MTYAIDTNAIIHHLHKKVNVRNNFDTAIAKGCKIVIPKPVDYEVRRGFYLKPHAKKEESYDILLETCAVIELNTTIWDYAIPIYATHYNNRHTADEMDILIAALCIQHNFTLVTNNTKDFRAISGLKFVDWSAAAES